MARKKQRQYDTQVFERFLTGHASAKYLCRQVALSELANDLVPLLCNLQEAHQRLVNREANRVLVLVIKSLRAKVIPVGRAQKLFRLDGAALNALLIHLDAQPKQDLTSHLSNAKRRVRPKRQNMTQRNAAAHVSEKQAFKQRPKLKLKTVPYLSSPAI